MTRLFRMLILLLIAANTAQACSSETAMAADPDDKPIRLRIWISDDLNSATTKKDMRLPLVVISHGTGGGDRDHQDTACALADTGFVVAAVMHTGDNYKDQSYAHEGRQPFGRPRHISRAIDFMLSGWRAHSHIDPARIGMFGFSAGGFTTLVLAGGTPDLSRMAEHCKAEPDAWDCRYLRKNGVRPSNAKRSHAWARDPRIRVAVVAAPAVGYSFEPGGLAAVHIPLQLWSGARDEVVENSSDIVRQLLPIAPEYHLVAGAGHFSFMSPCDVQLRVIITVLHWFGTENICTDPSGFDRIRFHNQFNAEVVRFFTAHMKANPGHRA